MKIWEPKPPGTLWGSPGLLRDSFTFPLHTDITLHVQFANIVAEEDKDKD
jgi:hypothetical protein